MLREKLAGQSGPTLWRSLEALAETPEARALVEAEFPDLFRPDLVDRRTLLRLMAASLALGGLAACEGQGTFGAPLYSHPRKVPGHVDGEPLVFATSFDLDGVGRGVLVSSHEGRPIKAEGNPLHPASLGASDVWMQAEVLGLYDPDRLRVPHERGLERAWADAARLIGAEREALAATGGRGLRVLAEPLASPTRHMIREAFARTFPEAVWHEYAPLHPDAARAGAVMAFGRPLDTVLDLARADAVLCLGGDLFLEAPGHVRYAADFAARKREPGPRPRLWVAEASPSVAGASAHERIVLRPREIESFARAVLAALGGATAGDAHPVAARVAADLARAGARGVVVAGREQPPIVHALAHAANAALASEIARTIEPVDPFPTGRLESLLDLAQALAAGTVSHLLILGGNPVYDGPAELDLANLVARVPFSLHVTGHRNETSVLCRWDLPRRHVLESWGDVRAHDGTVGLRQPTTVGGFEATTPEEFVAGFVAGRPQDGQELVQALWRERWGETFDARWAEALEAGVVPDTAFPAVPVQLAPNWDPGPQPASGPPAGLAVAFAPDPAVWDGRFSNNGWLQELPRPLTKIVWGNAALIAPATAAAHGLRTGDLVEVAVGGRSVRAPAWIMPGQAADTITLPLGYGRARAGKLGDGIGFDAYRLRTAAAPWHAEGASLAAIGERRAPITTQDHHSMEGRDIVRVVAPGEPAAPREATHPPHQPSLYPEYPYPTHAWGMTIDLDACIGCNACVVACQAENNIPVVGPEEVARHREMHWLRIDRYFAGTPAEPRTYFHPVPCMHCEKAPCEVVCPVNATVHSSEGLNDMVYNRCIGTRTCSNNCPYKVRRFNWYEYGGRDVGTQPGRANPQVSVRLRGVMEKCTFCVQRIGAARIRSRIEGTPIADGEIVTACQQACPTQAIVFGDLNDKQSRVAQLKADPRAYGLLAELNTQPRTSYLAKVEEPEEGRG